LAGAPLAHDLANLSNFVFTDQFDDAIDGFERLSFRNDAFLHENVQDALAQHKTDLRRRPPISHARAARLDMLVLLENGLDPFVRLHTPLPPAKIGGAHDPLGGRNNLRPESFYGPNAGPAATEHRIMKRRRPE